MKLVENEDNLGTLVGLIVVGVFIVTAVILPLLFPQLRIGVGGLQGSMPDEMLVIVPVVQISVVAVVTTAAIFSINKIRQQKKEVTR